MQFAHSTTRETVFALHVFVGLETSNKIVLSEDVHDRYMKYVCKCTVSAEWAAVFV